MTRGTWLLGTFVTAFAVGAAPTWAQDSRQPTSSGQSTGGSAVSRDTGAPVGGSSTSSGSAGSGSASSSAGGGGWSAPSSPSAVGNSPGSRSEYFVAPSHPSERQQSRQRGEGDSRRPSGGSSDSGGRAVPRGGSDSAPPSGGSSRGASASGDNNDAPSRRAVPAYSRPRDGRTQTGTAVERGSVIGGGGSLGYYPYYGFGSSYYRSPYRLYYVPGGYGFGLGYFYDPFWYDPYGYDAYGSGYGYGSGGGYGGGYYGGSGSSDYSRAPTGSLRLKIKPREAQVYVDGYLVGDVDSFDGVFQKLGIDAGGHRIEVRAEGYESAQFDVLISPGETVTYRGDLKAK